MCDDVGSTDIRSERLRAVAIDWDGTHLPDGLRLLPPGTYIVHFVEDIHELTSEEEAGILEAMDDIEAGHGIPYEGAMREIRCRYAAKPADPEPPSRI
ncbi:MAG TPA: hypothetical protein VFH48_24345 [Chloroflexota bacterium]|nr:hypothetical protein [Chloroflexota bacterium]